MTLYACLDSQKVIRGRYVFVLTVQVHRKFAIINSVNRAAEGARNAGDDCTFQTGSAPNLNVDVPVTVAGAGEITTDIDKIVLNSDLLSGFAIVSFVGNNNGGGSVAVTEGAVGSASMNPINPPDGPWLSIDNQCAGLSLSKNLTCQIMVTANPFKLVGASQGQTFTSSIRIESSNGTRTDLMVTLNYTRQVASQVFAHIADGNDKASTWRTDFVLTNPTGCDVTMDLIFHMDPDTGGVVPLVQLEGYTDPVSKVQNIAIPARGSVRYRTTGLSSNLLIVGWAEVNSPVPLGGQAVYYRLAPDKTIYTAAVPVVPPTSQFTLTYDGTQFGATLTQTGIAIVNTDSINAVSVACTYVSTTSDGVTTTSSFPIDSSTGFRILNGFVHTANTLSNLAMGTRGLLTCSGTQPVAPIGLVFLGPLGFSTISIDDVSQN